MVIKTRQRIGRGQVSAIQHLVAAAVQGLSANAVAIVDDKGELLAGGDGRQRRRVRRARRGTQTTDFEDRLRQRVESIVASVVGPGHARVQVAADMDFNRVTETAETFDPDSKVVRSSQTVQQIHQRSGSQQRRRRSASATRCRARPRPHRPPATGRRSPTRAPKRPSITRFPRPPRPRSVDGGTVKKLSVAVVVDGTYTPGANGPRAYAPRSPPTT